MAACPECDFDIELDENDVDEGDEYSCPECGSSLIVSSVDPLELDFAADDDEDEDEEEEDDDDDDEEDEEEEEEEDDWEE